MEVGDLLPRSDEDNFCGLSFAERLEKLKPIIVKLYMGNYGPGGKRMVMRQVVEYMKDKYSFHIARNQLEYALRKWKIRRRILNREKDDITVVLSKRSRAGTSTSDVTLQEGKPVDKKQLKRYLQDKIRRYVAEPIVPGVLSQWRLPYNAFENLFFRQLDMPSPVVNKSITPSYITVNSPKNTAGASPPATTSPSMQLIHQRFRQDQSNLLLQGQFKELFVRCDRDDRIAMTNYMHGFWIHNFVTAKHWGRGPLLWKREMIIPMTLYSMEISPSAAANPEIFLKFSPNSSSDEATAILSPEQSCGWLIHVKGKTASDDFLETPWSLADLNGRSFPQLMRESIAESTFSSLSPKDLPISNSLIAESLHKDPSSLYLESLRFAIMAGNGDLAESLIEKGMKQPRFIESLKEFYPYHLAAIYLDGGTTCCSLFSALSTALEDICPLVQNYEDAAGHTVLDSLIISIIRSHTTRVKPRDVSSSFIDTDVYPGEEKDACGRWDADSPAIRQLFRRGKYRIPLDWKHPFCHSSVQAVYHIILHLFFPGNYVPHINHLSGLFVRHCVACGTKLSLGTLHLIVVLAFHLADSGIRGETLFGAVALLVCLLRLGANASFKAEVSFDEILGVAFLTECHHANLDAGDFMQTVTSAILDLWSPECQIGWHCMHGVLQLAKNGKIHRLDTEAGNQPGSGAQSDTMNVDNDANGDSDGSDGSDDGGESDNGHTVSTIPTASCWLEHPRFRPSFSCGNSEFGLIWASIQAEILTYRKVRDLDPWISDNFSMSALKKWLQGESVGLEIPFVQKSILRDHTICGWFDTQPYWIPHPSEVTKQHIANYYELESES
ncbi:hypothetical protein CFAM422_000688 [Trichoderma lentiforme]|uniref:Clr5 domain-containing protein n=1 Tax=Trichoderma lentiforme TaxID=1567552 RepID=A0A9P5CJ68_9HYPO|nr:hypothetical protein CFAM422_000688 [Trichoderma lentiforme]